MKKIVKALFRFVLGIIKGILSLCAIVVLCFAFVLGFICINDGRGAGLEFVYGLPKQFSFLESYLVNNKKVLTTKELQQYFSPEQDEGKNYSGSRVRFSGIYNEDTQWVSLLVYPRYEGGDSSSDSWKNEALGIYSFHVEFEEGVKVSTGYIEGEGILLLSSVKITKAENKQFDEISWEEGQVTSDKDFRIQYTKKLDLSLHNGDVITHIDFANMGAYFYIEHKEEETDVMIVEQGGRNYYGEGHSIWNEQTEVRWIPGINSQENIIISFGRGIGLEEVFRTEVSLE